MTDLLTCHGRFFIEVNGNHIYTELHESFNDVGVQHWIDDMKQAIKQMAGKPFTILVNETAATGATPEALELANEYNEWLNQQALIAKAVVYSEEVFKQIDISNLPARKQQNIQFFDDTQMADNWLTEELNKAHLPWSFALHLNSLNECN